MSAGCALSKGVDHLFSLPSVCVPLITACPAIAANLYCLAARLLVMSTTEMSSVHSLARCGVAVGVDTGQSMLCCLYRWYGVCSCHAMAASCGARSIASAPGCMSVNWNCWVCWGSEVMHATVPLRDTGGVAHVLHSRHPCGAFKALKYCACTCNSCTCA